MPLELFVGSVFSRVVDATAAVVAGAADTAFPTIPTYRRKRAVLLEGDQVPCIIVAPGSEGPRIVFETFGRGIAYGYPVMCALIFPSNAIHTAIEGRYIPASETTEEEYADVMRTAESVRDAVYKPSLAGVDSVFNAEVVLAPAFEAVGANASMYAVAGVVVTYHSLESRAA